MVLLGHSRDCLTLPRNSVASVRRWNCFLIFPFSVANTFWSLLSDNKTFLRKLDVVQNKILRTILGAFRSTPVPQLYFESGVIPLSFRRLWLGAKYLINLSENPNNPAFHTIFSLISSNTSFRSPTTPSEIRLHYALLEKSINISLLLLLLKKTFPLGRDSQSIFFTFPTR